MTRAVTCHRLLVVLLLGLLASCAADRPAPVVDRSIGLAKREPQPPPGQYVVQRGDTLYSIAFRFGLDFKNLARWNGIAPPYTIYPGQEIRFEPGPAETGTSRTSPAGTAASGVRTEPLPEEPSDERVASEPSPAPAKREPARPPAEAQAAEPEEPASPAPAADTGPIRWQWPAGGPILSRFASGDASRNGIDIGGESGAPVRAAAGGEVVYSGSGLIGYGELIIVKHDNALLSAYGHNRKRLVQEGDRVQAGQQIAELGQTGAPRAMLHFEIREDGKPVDPMKYLPRR